MCKTSHSDLARLTWSNIDLSQNKKVIRFMQKKTKGKTPKSKVEIPIHEALEEYLLSGPTFGAPNAPVFPELHGKSGSWQKRSVNGVQAHRGKSSHRRRRDP